MRVVAVTKSNVIWRPELFQNSKMATPSTLNLSDRGAFINR